MARRDPGERARRRGDAAALTRDARDVVQTRVPADAAASTRPASASSRSWSARRARPGEGRMTGTLAPGDDYRSAARAHVGARACDHAVVVRAGDPLARLRRRAHPRDGAGGRRRQPHRRRRPDRRSAWPCPVAPLHGEGRVLVDPGRAAHAAAHRRVPRRSRQGRPRGDRGRAPRAEGRRAARHLRRGHAPGAGRDR